MHPVISFIFYVFFRFHEQYELTVDVVITFF